jgi:hypothetical protein
VFRREVVVSMKSAREMYTRWQELASQIGATSDMDEFDWTTKELKKALKSISWDLTDLDETVDVVEQKPEKFNVRQAGFCFLVVPVVGCLSLVRLGLFFLSPASCGLSVACLRLRVGCLSLVCDCVWAVCRLFAIACGLYVACLRLRVRFEFEFAF